MKQFNYFAIILFLVALKVGAKTDKYRLILTDDPSSTITIAWNQVSGTNPIVKFGTEDYGQNVALYNQTKRVDRTTAFRGMSNQFARLKDLQPN